MSTNDHNLKDESGSRPQRTTDPERLARVYLRMQSLKAKTPDWLNYWQGRFWRWTGRHYQLFAPHEMHAEVTRCLQLYFGTLRSSTEKDEAGDEVPALAPTVTRGLVGNVIQALQAITLVPEVFEMPGWHPQCAGAPGRHLVMTNGLLNLDHVLAGTPTMPAPHNPHWFSCVALDYAYDPEAACPQWIAFLHWAQESDADRIALLQEWFGYLLTPDTSQQRFLAFEGQGANGKSVVLDVLTALLGQANVSNIPLELFADKFQLIRSVGRLANIAPDVDSLDKVAEGTLKAFAAGDRMYFDQKYLPGIEARPTARLVFSTNDLLRFADQSEGIWRRLCVVPFRVTVSPDHRDRHLASKLIAELSGIFNWAIEGLRRLADVGHFTEPAVSIEAREEHRGQSDPVRRHLRELYKEALGASVPCAEVSNAVKWALEMAGERSVTDAVIGRRVHGEFPGVKRARVTIGIKREWMYEGLAWREPPEPAPAGLSRLS